jgi:hypothetical protein
LFRQAVQEKAESKKQKAEIKNGLKFTFFPFQLSAFPISAFFSATLIRAKRILKCELTGAECVQASEIEDRRSERICESSACRSRRTLA